MAIDQCEIRSLKFEILRPVTFVVPLCAWCLAEQAKEGQETEEIVEGSHGICREHADAILLQHRKLRGRQRNAS